MISGTVAPRIAATVFLVCFGCDLFAVSPETPDAIDFNRDIRPILSDNCFQCHGPDAETRASDLRLDSFAAATDHSSGAAAIVPGDADASELIRRIEDVDDPMPPTESKRILSPREKRLLRSWVQSGAPFEQHWAFTPPHRPATPVVDVETKNAIDAFVSQRLKQAGLSFSPEAAPSTLIRRVTLDLTGIPPTPDEVDVFLRDYQSHGDTAYVKLVERLIGSPRYGETMALPWLDAARFADTDGYQYDGPRFQWRWRDWVINAYNHNMPFDQFTIEQLAGDLIPGASLDQQIATAFNRNHRYNSEAGLVVEEFLLENAVDRVDTTSTLWMGLTMGCARCHDHKFDPISQQDYYQLVAFFNSIPEAGRAIKSGNSEPVCYAPTNDQQTRLDELERSVRAAHDALRPGDSMQQGGQLIDRKLIHHFPLEKQSLENAKTIGDPTFDDQSLILNGKSSVELAGLDKALRFRADERFSISFWLRPDSLQNSVILSRHNPGTTRPGIEIAIVDNGRVQFDLITRWVAGVGRVTTRQSLPVAEWSHVAVTNDGSQSAGGQRVYFNGNLVETDIRHNTNSNVGGVDANRPMILGAGSRPGSQNFRGAMRKIGLFQTELWPEEIRILAAQYGGKTRTEFSRIKMTEGYRRYVKAKEQLESFRQTLPTVMVMKETPQPKPTHIRIRGEYDKLGDRVQRNVPSMLPPLKDDLPRNRLGLAMWLVSPEHPLTARVAVNRYWQKYFGQGLVSTPEDFGTQSAVPSHPNLLDWLAVEFIKSGWDIAAMQKLIVTSRTYRQQSKVTAELLETDPANTLLARAPRLRLTAHAIRDQALFVAGLMAEQIGGPSVSPYQPEGLWAEMSMGMKYKQSEGADLFRRSLYTIWKRTIAPPTMAVFDAADRESCWVGRKETNTPLQALTLLNETGFIESARHLAVRMMGSDDPIETGFRIVTCRPPQPHERAALSKSLEKYREFFSTSPESAAMLIRIGQSPACEKYQSTEIAAYTSLANALLNLDEVITRE